MVLDCFCDGLKWFWLFWGASVVVQGLGGNVVLDCFCGVFMWFWWCKGASVVVFGGSGKLVFGSGSDGGFNSRMGIILNY